MAATRSSAAALACSAAVAVKCSDGALPSVPTLRPWRRQNPTCRSKVRRRVAAYWRCPGHLCPRRGLGRRRGPAPSLEVGLTSRLRFGTRLPARPPRSRRPTRSSSISGPRRTSPSGTGTGSGTISSPAPLGWRASPNRSPRWSALRWSGRDHGVRRQPHLLSAPAGRGRTR